MTSHERAVSGFCCGLTPQMRVTCCPLRTPIFTLAWGVALLLINAPRWPALSTVINDKFKPRCLPDGQLAGQFMLNFMADTAQRIKDSGHFTSKRQHRPGYTEIRADRYRKRIDTPSRSGSWNDPATDCRDHADSPHHLELSLGFIAGYAVPAPPVHGHTGLFRTVDGSGDFNFKTFNLIADLKITVVFKAHAPHS